jgi:hypothetical protein
VHIGVNCSCFGDAEAFRSLERLLPGVNFDEIDRDKDGFLDVAELRHFLLNNAHLLKVS